MLGEVAERALMRRQFYVGNTRYRGAHRIYVSHREAILDRLSRADPGRELATEFVARHRIVADQRETVRATQRMRERMWQWLGMVRHWQQMQETRGERMEP